MWFTHTPSDWWKDSHSTCGGVEDTERIMKSSSLTRQRVTVVKHTIVPITATKCCTRVLSHGGKTCGINTTTTTTRHGLAARKQEGYRLVCRAQGDDEKNVTYNDQFGYSRKDIILIGVGLIGMGFFLNWLLQSVFQMDAIMAGNYAQLIIFVGLCVGWIGSYLFRVATKQMTYAKQLEDYEEAVMQKRLEELPEAELENIMESIEEEKRRRGEM